MQLKCETCSHYDGEYCCSGIIDCEDVRIKDIPNLVRDVEEKYGAVECPYEEMEDVGRTMQEMY